MSEFQELYEFYLDVPVDGYDVDDVKQLLRKPAGKRKTGRQYRRTMKFQKDMQLFHIVKQRYKPHVGWIYNVPDNFRCKLLKGTGLYIQYPNRSNRQRFLKRQTAKKVRKSSGIPNGNVYRKYYEYWWIMY